MSSRKRQRSSCFFASSSSSERNGFEILNRVVGRDTEMRSILNFLEVGKGSLYTCGTPGTGKTLSVRTALSTIFKSSINLKKQVPRVIWINAMGLKDPLEIFTSVLPTAFYFSNRYSQDFRDQTRAEILEKCVENFVSQLYAAIAKSRTDRWILVVDEIDALCMSSNGLNTSSSTLCKGNRGRSNQRISSSASSVMQKLFQLPSLFENFQEKNLEKARSNGKSGLKKKLPLFCFIGLANTIDVIRGMSGWLQSRSFNVQELIFTPYSHDQLRTIIREAVPDFDDIHVELVCRKVAACHGDCRKAISLCREALRCSKNEKTDSRKCDTTLKIISRCSGVDQDILCAMKSLAFPLQMVLAAVSGVALSTASSSSVDLREAKKLIDEFVASQRLPQLTIRTMQEQLQSLAGYGLLKVTVPDAPTRRSAINICSLASGIKVELNLGAEITSKCLLDCNSMLAPLLNI